MDNWDVIPYGDTMSCSIYCNTLELLCIHPAFYSVGSSSIYSLITSKIRSESVYMKSLWTLDDDCFYTGIS